MLDYILTIKDASKRTDARLERWDAATFNQWVAEQGEKIGGNFETRLDQFRRYTGKAVIDWEMDA